MRLLFFAQLRQATGRHEAIWSGTGRLDAPALWARLIEEYPALARHRPTVRLARNGVYARADENFEPGDEIALIPPVSGG